MIECAEENLIDFSYEEIDNKPLLDFAGKLPNQGTLVSNDNIYYFLKVIDDFILELCPLIENEKVIMPDYFLPYNNTGAHISIFHSNEIIEKPIEVKEKGETFSFEVKSLIKLNVLNRAYFTLIVYSQELEELRLRYGFNPKPNFRGLIVPFHITIARGILE